MITRKMRLSMAMLTIAASVLTTGNIKADEKDTTNETNTATESKYANKAVADIYSTTTLNIRKKGSINAKIVGKMKKGNIATVLKKGSEWSKVRSGNVTGYVKNQYLVFGDEIENFAKQNVKKVAKVQTETLRVRKKASTDSKIVTLVSEDDKLKVKKQTNDWAKVKVEGQTGYVLDVEKSIDAVYDYLTEEWNHEACSIPLEIVVDEPKGSAKELAQVTDVLGSFTTSYKTSGSSRSANVANGCSLINGTTLYPGEEFSTYKTVSPFSVANGYYMAGSYVSGKVVDSLGGGICQVSTTLYNAVLRAELEVTERYNHSMIVGYVDPSADAAIAESSGKDFKFVNNTDAPIYIEGYTHDKQITFNIYGKETRAAGHSVRYESEVLETITPPADQIYADAGQPIGYIVTESAHIGYKARLWKITMENGVEVSREQVNSSTYKMVPRSATVGTATSDPQAYEEIMAAISTANIDHVKNVAAALNARAAAAAGQTEIVDD